MRPPRAAVTRLWLCALTPASSAAHGRRSVPTALPLSHAGCDRTGIVCEMLRPRPTSRAADLGECFSIEAGVGCSDGPYLRDGGGTHRAHAVWAGPHRLPGCRLRAEQSVILDEVGGDGNSLESTEETSHRETGLSLIHISEPTRQAEISYAAFC